MNEILSFKTRLYFTGVITLFIGLLLIWDYYHGGVPTHHIMQRADLPGFSNWWGGLLLPLLTWFLLYRIQKRMNNNKNTSYIKDVQQRFAGSLLYGVLLSVFFTMGYSDLPFYLLLSIFVWALFFPIYRSECLLGFVIGMAFTFGGVLPIIIGTILTTITAVLYLYVRRSILYVYE